MTTDKTIRHQIKITIPANTHLDEIVRKAKEAGQSVSKTRLVSQWILSQPLVGFVHRERGTVVDVDYCPNCRKVVSYHNDRCHECNSELEHLTAIPRNDLMSLMALARIVNVNLGNRS